MDVSEVPVLTFPQKILQCSLGCGQCQFVSFIYTASLKTLRMPKLLYKVVKKQKKKQMGNPTIKLFQKITRERLTGTGMIN